MNSELNLNDYTFVKDLGDGYNAQVKLYREKVTNELIAIKHFTCLRVTPQDANETFEKEKQIIQYLMPIMNSNVIRLIGTGSEEIDCPNQMAKQRQIKQNFLALQFLGNGSLCNYIQQNGPLSEMTAKHYFVNLIKNVKLMNQNGIVHRDLTLQNLLIDDNYNLTLIDFSFACQYSSEGRQLRLADYIGTPPYISPEIVDTQPHYPYPSEVFALGVLLHIMVYGKDPFKLATLDNQDYQDFLNRVPESELDQLIQAMVQYRQAQRPTIDDILKCAWLDNYKQSEMDQAIQEVKQNLNQSRGVMIKNNQNFEEQTTTKVSYLA